jgi:hypothetical protein
VACFEASVSDGRWNSAIVQILVIVANTKLRMFWAEVDKGSVRTVFGYGLGGPKA